jgi:DnaJ-class molecular chaperone
MAEAGISGTAEVERILREKCYYRILHVNRSAEAKELKAAYRALARAVHPDRNRHPQAEKAFASVNEAYGTLADDSRRRVYDLTSPTQHAQRGFARHQTDHSNGTQTQYTFPFGGFGANGMPREVIYFNAMPFLFGSPFGIYNLGAEMRRYAQYVQAQREGEPTGEEQEISASRTITLVIILLAVMLIFK